MDAPSGAQDYRTILKEELADRCRQNARYSLCAFARDLSISPSRLSEILNGKQGLSRESAERITRALGFGPMETERFCDMVVATHARSRKERELARVRLRKYQTDAGAHQLSLDAFKIISDWYHFGILELTQIRGFKSEPKWIARKLRISEVEVKLAIERLERLGLIGWQKGRLVARHPEGDVFAGNVPSDSIKKAHTQIMKKALDAIWTQSLDQREFRAQVIAIDRRKLKTAKKALIEFENRFCIEMEEAKSKDSLYCLAIQFFDLAEGG